MTKRDYYEILEVSRTATVEELKTSYRKLAMKYHPDRNPGNKEAEEKFKECAEAYEVLKDPQKRQRYDQFGHQGVNSTGFQGFDNINDIFSQFSDIFGGFGGGSIFDDLFGQRRGSQRSGGVDGNDLKLSVSLTLEEIAEGIEKTLKVKHYKECQTCSGSGAKPGSGYDKCGNCNGSGEIRQVTRSVFGQFINVSMCPKCNGEGRVVKDKCADCHGEGRLRTESTVKVNIPAGVSQGNYIPIRGHGDAGMRGGRTGSLLVFIEEAEHEHFVRDGDDVLLDLDVSITDAVLGADIIVPTLKGKAKISIDQGTQPGDILRMKDKGIKHLNSNGRGDQLVRVNVHIPSKVSSKEKTILKELGKSENFKPNDKKKGSKKNFFETVFS